MNEKAHSILVEDNFDPSHLHHKETVFTIGNGYLSTRGTFEEGYPGEQCATLIHGIFDDVPLFFTELVNAPDWTSIFINIDGERFSLAEGTILDYGRSIDLRNGCLSRHVRWQSRMGKILTLDFERFASLADPHILCQRLRIIPLNFSGKIEAQAGLNGYQDTVNVLHWQWRDQFTDLDSAWLHLQTRSTGIELALAMRVRAEGGDTIQQEGWNTLNQPTLAIRWLASPGEALTLEKVVTLYTSRDTDLPVRAANSKLIELSGAGWETLFTENQIAWEKEWQKCDVIIEGDEEAQLAMCFNLFQLLIAAPRRDERVSIGAKTLSGFGYRGHVFWDTEVFMLPFFTYTRPEIAYNLLSYRWHTLPGARRKAGGNGFAGAQYAWESAATGDEVTPTWLLHPTDPTQLIRIWTGDIEIHVSADIAYAIWQYWQVTGDDRFMCERGAEIFLETARFWARRAEWNEEVRRYEFNDVIGPDEYHDHVDNNAFTNYLAIWHLEKAQEVINWLDRAYPQVAQDLFARLEIDPDVRQGWRSIASKIYRPFDPVTRLIEQFEGYFSRQDVNLAGREARSQSMQAILGIEGVNQTQVIKQPDVLMLIYLLPELFGEDTVRANYVYYNSRTDHTFGSSLGPALNTIIACRVGAVDQAYEHFLRAAHADLYDVRGNAGDGIHGASAGGLWQAVVFGFAGLKVEGDAWSVNPRLPGHWRRLAFKFTLRGVEQSVNIVREDEH